MRKFFTNNNVWKLLTYFTLSYKQLYVNLDSLLGGGGGGGGGGAEAILAPFPHLQNYWGGPCSYSGEEL